MIFQNPYASLDPKMTLQRILEEPLRIKRYSREQRNRRIAELLDYIGFSQSLLQRYPREFSGGQRQRIAIARVLACNPEFIVLDEPVSALDVSIQAQILNLLVDLQREMGLTYLFISHDLGVVQYVSDRVCVMYLGQIVEMANFQSLYELQLHPYTRLLIQSVPVPDPRNKQELSPAAPPVLQVARRIPGCQFQNRCATVKDVCREKEPELVEYRKGHLVACHLYTPPVPQEQEADV
jgi:oligopeptide transport system ATP-binding protein